MGLRRKSYTIENGLEMSVRREDPYEDYVKRIIGKIDWSIIIIIIILCKQ